MCQAPTARRCRRPSTSPGIISERARGSATVLLSCIRISRRTPTSPSHRSATAPPSPPLKGGEGIVAARPGDSLPAPGGGEGRGEVGDPRALANEGKDLTPRGG